MIAYLACLVPVGAWSIFRMLDEGLPVWTLQMRAWDVIGTVAYVQAFALVESLVVFAPLTLLAAALPSSWLRDRFLPMATGIVYASAAWFVAAHFNDETLRTWGFRQLLPWVTVYGASLLAIALLIHRSSRLRWLLVVYADRVTVLATTYLLIAVAAVGIVVIRNI